MLLQLPRHAICFLVNYRHQMVTLIEETARGVKHKDDDLFVEPQVG
jgi:hypothetical protein